MNRPPLGRKSGQRSRKRRSGKSPAVGVVVPASASRGRAAGSGAARSAKAAGGGVGVGEALCAGSRAQLGLDCTDPAGCAPARTQLAGRRGGRRGSWGQVSRVGASSGPRGAPPGVRRGRSPATQGSRVGAAIDGAGSQTPGGLPGQVRRA